MSGSGWAVAALAAALAIAGAAEAQDVPAGAPPSWPSLIRCAQLPDDDAQLACFKAAMKASGYAPKPAEVAAERHHRFGLSAPDLNLFRKKQAAEGESAAARPAAPAVAAAAPAPASEPVPPPPGVAPHPESEDDVFVRLERVALMPPNNQLLLVTADGGIWEQVDYDTVAPLPRQGQSMEIKKNMFGGYLCIFDKRQGVRCKRVH
jgi:hypothetical protein